MLFTWHDPNKYFMIRRKLHTRNARHEDAMRSFWARSIYQRCIFWLRVWKVVPPDVPINGRVCTCLFDAMLARPRALVHCARACNIRPMMKCAHIYYYSTFSTIRHRCRLHTSFIAQRRRIHKVNTIRVGKIENVFRIHQNIRSTAAAE